MSIPRHIELLQQGKSAEAEQLLRAALMFRPDDPRLNSDMALAKLDQGNPLMAERGWRYVLSRNPEHFDAAANLGDLLIKRGRITEAETLFRERLKRNPNEMQSMSALAHVLIEEFRIGEALPLLAQAAGYAGPTEWAARATEFSALQIERNVKACPHAFSEFLSYGLHTGYDAAAHREWLLRFAKHHIESADVKSIAPQRPWDGKRPLRVGFVGNVFREHACAYVLEPILQHTTHEAVIYADNVPRDATSKRLRGVVRYWRDTFKLPMDQYAAQLRADNLDVIVDLMGHKEGGRLLALASHPAPVMLGYIGYAGETLLTQNIDAEVGWAYRPSDDAPPIAQLPYDRNGFVTFGSVHRAAKLTTEVLQTWGKLLQAMPTARLLVACAGGEKNAPARLQMVTAGIPADRVELVDKSLTRTGYLAFANHIDIHLDTFPYGGGATIFDMLWQGVPTISLAGGNVTGMPSFLPAHSVEEYIDVCRSPNIERLREIRQGARMLLPDAIAVASRFDAAITTRATVTTEAAVPCCN